MSEARLAMLPIEQIQASNFNPRQFFDVQELHNLADSIKRDGLTSPILVRPLQNDNYEVVAGERRFRASHIAEQKLVDCKIEEMDDETAIRRALKENTEREDMSAIEEAFAARTALTLVDGNRKSACAVLSWNETKLANRLLLLNLSQVSQEALMQKQIHVGHAELLSTLTHDNQDNAISSIIEKGISVSELKEKLAQFAYKLDTAIFDTAKCNGCPNNTSSQFTLFDESIGDGCCTNPDCWDEKEKSKLLYIKKATEEDYNVVYLDVERTPDSYNYLQVSVVGDEQFSQCQQCGKCGALISTRRETLGECDEEVCFDTNCYKEKTAPKEVKKDEYETAKKPTTAVAKEGDKTNTKKSVDNKLPKKVLEFKTRLYKSIVSKELITDRHMMTAMNACILLESLPKQHSGSEIIKSLQTIFKLPFEIKAHSSHDRFKTIPKLLALSDDELNEITAFCTSVIIASGDNNHELSQQDKSVETIIETMKPDLSDHFTLDKAYLECNQKTGIVAILKESGFDKWFDERGDGKGSFTKLAKSTVLIILETFSKSGFPVQGFVPTALNYNTAVDTKDVDATPTQEKS